MLKCTIVRGIPPSNHEGLALLETRYRIIRKILRRIIKVLASEIHLDSSKIKNSKCIQMVLNGIKSLLRDLLTKGLRMFQNLRKNL
jgi:hypothetical protein